MRNFLLKNLKKMLWLITATHLFFLALFITRYKKTKNILYLLSGLVTFGLFYDALIISLGSVIKDESLLKKLSKLRFISHGALIPLLFPICTYSLEGSSKAKLLTWALTAVVSIMGVAEGTVTDLEFKEIADVKRYTASKETPKWAEMVSSLLSYGTVFPLIGAGAVAWSKEKTPSLFLSGFLMFAFAALGPATGNFDLIFFISMFGEVFMAAFLGLFAKHKDKK